MKVERKYILKLLTHFLSCARTAAGRHGRTLAAFALFLLSAGVYFSPELRERLKEAVYGRAEAELLSYVVDVLKENRTGLSSIEELRLAETILNESIEHKLDPLFVLALIETESDYYNWSRSLKGAVGLMQILPSTGRGLAEEMSLKWRGELTLLNPYTNVKMGVHYLSELMKRFGNDTRTTLVAYNAGPAYASLAKGRTSDGTVDPFARRVLENYKDLKERAGLH